jgi:uncharacterized membrane protein YdjX (TVP38/TMEM64 family)
MAEKLPPASTSQTALKLVALAALGGLAAWLAFNYGGQFNLQSLAQREQALRSYAEAHPALSLGIAFAVYVAVTGLSLPGAAALTLLYGWLFGFGRALVLVSFASTSGATLAFLLSRFVLGGAIQARFGDRLQTFNAAIEREGAFYLFTLRLIPQVPFFIINVVMGLTKIRLSTFWWVSQLGMLPGTCVYVLAGSRLPGLAKVAAEGISSVIDFNLILAITALGVFPILAKLALNWLRPKAASPPPDSTTTPTR